MTTSKNILSYGEKANDSTLPHSENNFLYGGKKLQDRDDIDWYDSGARFQTTFGIFTSIDPDAEKYYSISPYAYCVNNPVNYIDPDGREWTDNNGNVIKNEDLKNVKVYIFYSDDFSKQAMKQYDKAVEKYGARAVALSNTGTTDGFSTDWGNMQGEVNSVMIMTHGKNQSIAVADGEQFTSTGTNATNKTNSYAPNIQDLPTPQAEISQASLLMYSCHSADNNPKAHGRGDHAQGDLKGTGKPIAQVFAEQFNFAHVQGTKGSVNYSPVTYSVGPNMIIHNPNGLMPYPVDGKWVRYSHLYRPIIIGIPGKK